MPTIEQLAQKPGLERLTAIGPEQQSDEVLTLLETRYADADANSSVAGFLWATGCPVFYPYGEKAANYEQVTKADPILDDPEVMQYILERYHGEKDNPRVARLAAMAVKKAITLHLTPFDGAAAKDRQELDGLWQREIASAPNGQQVLNTVAQEKGNNPWQQYMQLRNRLTSGTLPQTEIEQLTPIFDTVERAAGKHEGRQLVRAIAKIRELGFENLDSYFELILGEPMSAVKEKTQILLDKMNGNVDRSTSPEDYFKYFGQLMDGYDNKIIPEDMDAALFAKLEELGIPQEEWEMYVVVCKNSIVEVETAYAYVFPGKPDFPERLGLDPDAETWDNKDAWDKIKAGARAGIALRGGKAETSDQVRLGFHEAGHIIEALMRIVTDKRAGKREGSSLIGRPMTVNEVFSLLNEANMPDTTYFKRKEGFLTHRYAALFMHELNLWNMAAQVTDEASFDEMMRGAETSYQQTMGDALNLRVSTGRCFRDFFDARSPFIAASYAFGMPLALELQERLNALSTPQARRELLEQVSEATALGKNVDAVAQALGKKWENIVEQVDLLK